MGRKNVLGTCYLLHFSGKVADHANHYIGWTEGDVEDRVAQHLKGQGNGLVRAAVECGFEVTVIRTWPNVDRHFERKLKNGHNRWRHCPICSEERKAQKERLRQIAMGVA